MLKRTTTKLLASFSIAAISLSTPAMAGWGDLLKQAEEKVKESAPELLDSVSGNDSGSAGKFSTAELIEGLKEALKIGTQRAVDTVSATNGYLGNPDIRIPMPSKLDQAGKLLRQVGLGSTVDQFEESMNHAAEKAAPKAKAIFLDTLSKMSIDDAKKIYEGADDSATRYFEESTRQQLSDDFKPLIVKTMDEVGVTRYYQQMVKKAEKYPLISDLDLNLDNYVTDQALDGLFTMLAAEEKAIREDPAARTTELLKKLFSQ